MNTKQQNLNPAERTIVASRMLGASPQGSPTGQRFVDWAAESSAYPGSGRCVAQPAISLAAGGFGKRELLIAAPGHTLRT